MMKRELVGILSACLALSLGGAVMAACAPTEPEVTEGAVYVTEAKSFWAGVGSGYLSFEYKEEPETPAEGERYGYVFHVMVDSGDGYSSYMSGNWELEGTEGSYGTLSLTGYWDSTIENPTMLDGAESGVAKEYEPTDGKYTIGVSIPSAGVLNFMLDPVADKVGEGERPEPEKPCTNHVDENGDGKCDVCGEDMPEEEQPSEGEVQVLLTAQASIEPFEGYTVTAEAKLELYTDERWAMFVKTDADPANPDFVEAASGTYTVDTTTYVTTLTVTEQLVENSLPVTFTVNCDASAYPELAYSAEVAYTSAGFTFNFAFTDIEEEEPAKTPLVTLTGTSSISPFEGFTVNANAKLELYEDGTWTLFIKTDADPANPDFTEAASGAYTNTQTEMTLTVTEELMKESLPETIEVAVNAATYPTIGYSTDFTYTSTGFDFAFELTGTMEM